MQACSRFFERTLFPHSLASSHLAAQCRTFRIAVIGSGPAGFYFVDRVSRLLGDELKGVDILDRLPTPFGLVRSGVAPDHPDTKNVINRFTAIAERPNVRFFGNVTVGKDITITELRGMYNCVVLAAGAANDRRLAIENAAIPGVFTAREFVNWYNGHPDHVNLPIHLKRVESVGIVGLGNVAIDCARVLLKPVADLEATDIADHALEQLRVSSVRAVHIIGRRGPLQAQFTGKELREILGLSNVGVTVKPENYVPNDLDKGEPRKNQKVFAAMQKAHGKQPDCDPKRDLLFHFLRSPLAATPHSATRAISSLTLEHTALEPAANGGQRAVATGAHEELPVQLLLESVGYRGSAMADVPFDESQGVVPSIAGRVCRDASDIASFEPGLYVTGWLRRGPHGIIGNNILDASQTADSVAEDMTLLQQCSSDPDALLSLLKDRDVRVVDWAAWSRLDAHEQGLGAKAGRPRVKVTSISDMLAIAGV